VLKEQSRPKIITTVEDNDSEDEEEEEKEQKPKKNDS
jgi:hypothetical protein